MVILSSSSKYMIILNLPQKPCTPLIQQCIHLSYRLLHSFKLNAENYCQMYFVMQLYNGQGTTNTDWKENVEVAYFPEHYILAL